MFKRLILEDSSIWYLITAFVTAATIFLIITWRAVRMPRAEVDKFAQLPFTTDADERHDPSA
ncbi:MAG: hypothetical protein DUW69_001001 [Verrucomicrobia bacterium]|jgi:hypothetical protein|nr:MAG: hypothetical protein DUW69_001001 [Verrucomicrobiota bacterium]